MCRQWELFVTCYIYLDMLHLDMLHLDMLHLDMLHLDMLHLDMLHPNNCFNMYRELISCFVLYNRH